MNSITVALALMIGPPHDVCERQSHDSLLAYQNSFDAGVRSQLLWDQHLAWWCLQQSATPSKALASRADWMLMAWRYRWRVATRAEP